MAQGLPNGQYYYMPSTGAFPSLLAIGIGGQVQGNVWTTSVENDGGSAYEVWTVQATGTSAASFDIYPAADTGQKVTISGAAAATATLVATNLQAALEANAVAYGLVSVSRVTDTLTLTGRDAGVVIVVDNGSNVTLVNTVDAAQAERVPAGVAMIRTGRDDTGNTMKARRAVYTAFTAMAATCTYASVGAGGVAGMTIEYGGITRSVEVPYNTSNTQTTTDLYTALETFWNAAFAAGQSMVFTNPSAGVILVTADVAGGAFRADPYSTGTASVAYNGDWNDPAYSLPAAYLGCSLFESGMIESSPGAADPAVPPGGNVRIATGGPGYANVPYSSATGPTFGAGAWTDATGSSAGRGQYYFAGSAASKRVPLYLPGRGWLAIASGDNDTTNGTAGLRHLMTNG